MTRAAQQYDRWQFGARLVGAAFAAYLVGYFIADWLTATYGNDGLLTAARMIATGGLR